MHGIVFVFLGKVSPALQQYSCSQTLRHQSAPVNRLAAEALNWHALCLSRKQKNSVMLLYGSPGSSRIRAYDASIQLIKSPPLIIYPIYT